MEEDIYIECDECGMRYTVQCNDMHISEIDEDGEDDVYPKFCSFCGCEIHI
tara:strand:+ start:54 stop:206 length:153 start_codon:yes stop_codon:yes gene_type:complete